VTVREKEKKRISAAKKGKGETNLVRGFFGTDFYERVLTSS